MDVAIEVDVNVGLIYDSEEQNGWLKDGAGEGSWASMETVAVGQKFGCCSEVHAAIVGLGVEGSTLQESIGAEIGGASDPVDCHM